MERDAAGDYKVKDRSRKVAKRKRMPVNGIALKRLLIERQAKVEQGRKDDAIRMRQGRDS